MPDSVIPPSAEVLAEHVRRGEGDTCDCLACRLDALIEEAQALPLLERRLVLRALISSQELIALTILRDVLPGRGA